MSQHVSPQPCPLQRNRSSVGYRHEIVFGNPKEAAKQKFSTGLILLRQDDSTASTRVPNLAARGKRFAIFCGTRIQPGDGRLRQARRSFFTPNAGACLVSWMISSYSFALTIARWRSPFAARTRYYYFGVNRRLEKLRRELREN
jgi:hypothetical protein